MTTLSVVMPVRNGGEAFRVCLASVLQASPPADEVIVVSDASTDGSDEAAEVPGVKRIRLQEQQGAAKARNAGAAAATGDLLLFLDADVSIPPGLIGRVRELFEEEGAPDALFGSYDDRPAAAGFLSQFRNLLHHFVHQHGNPEASTFWTACGAVRREVFERLGGFGRRRMEDVEFGYRLREAGCRIRLVPGLQVTHHKRWTWWSMLKADVAYRAWPWTELIWKHGRMPKDLNLGGASRGSVALLGMSILQAAGLPFLSSGGRLWAGGLLVLMAAILLLLNRNVYAFFRRVRGWGFMLGAIPAHWLYYAYGGATFAVGSLVQLARRPWRRPSAG